MFVSIGIIGIAMLLVFLILFFGSIHINNSNGIIERLKEEKQDMFSRYQKAKSELESAQTSYDIVIKKLEEISSMKVTAESTIREWVFTIRSNKRMKSKFVLPDTSIIEGYCIQLPQESSSDVKYLISLDSENWKLYPGAKMVEA